MTLNDLKSFGELRHTDKILRLEWFGGVKWNVDEHDNPLIECLFSPLEAPNVAKGYTKPFLKRKDQFIAGLAVGYLPTLYIGQFFQYGKQLPISHWPLQPELVTFVVDVSNLSAVTESLLPDIGIDAKSEFIDPGFSNTANLSGLKRLRGRVTHASSEKRNEMIKSKGGSQPQDVIIHEMELIRFYLTNSSYSSKNLFNGSFSDAQLGVRVVNELHEKRSLDPVTGTGRFVYRHGYRNADASSLGRILLDPTGLALKAAQRVHNKIVAGRINSEQVWLGYPRTYFPFAGRTTLKLSGRYVSTSGGFVFLAYRIHSCSGPFPYKSLSYCDDTQPGGTPAPQGAPGAFSQAIVAAANEDSDLSIGESKSNEAPTADLKGLQIELGMREYVELSNIKLVREKLKDNAYGPGSKIKLPDANNYINASTGAPTWGSSTAAPQSLTEEVFVASKITVDLTEFIKAIKKLQASNRNWTITPIIIGDKPENFGQETSFFPKVPCEIHKQTMRQFSFMDDEKTIRRRFICVQFMMKGRYLYIFEAQLRPNGRTAADGTPEFKEKLPILLLHAPGYEEMYAKDFKEVIRQSVINTTWPSGTDLGVFIRDVQKHGKGSQTAEALANRIKMLVERNF